MNLKIENKEDIQFAINHLNSLKLGYDSKKRIIKYDFSCKRRNFKRSLGQNRLLWLWLGCISIETGNTTDILYDYYIDKYAPRISYIDPNGKERIKIVSSSKMSTKQKNEFLQKIDADVSTEGIRLTYPEDKYFEVFYEKYKDFIR